MARACACSPNGSNGAVPVAVDGRRNGDDLVGAYGCDKCPHHLGDVVTGVTIHSCERNIGSVNVYNIIIDQSFSVVGAAGFEPAT